MDGLHDEWFLVVINEYPLPLLLAIKFDCSFKNLMNIIRTKIPLLWMGEWVSQVRILNYLFSAEFLIVH